MRYIDREGTISTEDSGQDKLLARLYSSRFGLAVMKVLVSPAVSKAGGWFLDKKCSRFLIQPFIKKTQIDMSCYEAQTYQSYNDFFTRKIKPQCRPLEGDAQTVISPCDGKLSVYPIQRETKEETWFCIKDTFYTVESLLRSRSLAKRYEEGIACVFRLTVDDYHRYCYVDDGRKSENFHIPGVFHTVNPAANEVVSLYKENTRTFSLLQSNHFGTVLMMEVGALMVGRITNYHEACEVSKGQEKGRFEFGGSTIILLFEKDKVKIDDRLIENTRKGYETVIRLGERIGSANMEQFV